jgi:endonuclease YncB( thermonuclease family)
VGRRFRRRPPAWVWIAGLLAIAVAARWFLVAGDKPANLPAGPALVVAVLDGRTLRIIAAASTAGEDLPVRLIGLKASSDDAAARDRLSHLVGKTVELALDKRRQDRDGVPLAYVYFEQTLINAELLELGVADYASYPGDSVPLARQLREAAERGRARRPGAPPLEISELDFYDPASQPE